MVKIASKTNLDYLFYDFTCSVETEAVSCFCLPWLRRAMRLGDNQLIDTQRLNLLRWHASVCADGTYDRSKAWKKTLSEKTGLSPATVTNMCDVSEERSFRDKTMSALARPSDEAFIDTLGFEVEAEARKARGYKTNQQLLSQLAQVSRRDEYADICLKEDVSLLAEERERALSRLAASKVREREHSARWRTDDQAVWWQGGKRSDRLADEHVLPMHDSERRAVRKLFKKLVKGSSSETTIVEAFPHSGIAFALQALLPDQEYFQRNYPGGIVHVHIGAIQHRDRLRDRLKKELLKEDSDGNDRRYQSFPVEKRLANHLHANSQLLVIHGASAIPEHSKAFVENLSNALQETSKNQANRGISRLLLTSWDVGEFYYLNDRKPRRVTYDAEVDAESATAYFREALQYYRRLRGRQLQEGRAVGPRAENTVLKQVDYHYERKMGGATEFPSAIRYRAFCASDTRTPSPFDPTQGIWRRVDADMRNRIPEFTDCFADIQSDLRTYHAQERYDDLVSLRLISTGIFFFSSEMLDLLKAHEGSAGFAKCASFSSGSLRGKYVSLTDSASENSPAMKVATMPLLVRSVIQDDWMRYEADTRRVVHEALGNILFEFALDEDVEAWEKELPYSPPWGEVHLIMALEAIRHFMRAAQSSDDGDAAQLTRQALDVYDSLLERGTFPNETDLEDRRPAGELSRAHGLHALKYEALCLLSKDGKGKEAPRGLDPHSTIIYFRELGITLTRLLRTKEAKQAFMSALLEPGISLLERSYILSHQLNACLVSGDISEARSILDDLRELERFEGLEAPDRDNIGRRNDAREAALLNAEDLSSQSRAAWKRLSDDGLFSYAGDRALSYIDAHLPRGDGDTRKLNELSEVWAISERASQFAHENGFEHERLRLEIRRASIARALSCPEASVAILESVGLDLARHCGAEMLFREFQFEAATVLNVLGRPKYGFVAYAWPAFQSLRGRSASFWIEKANSVCDKLLRSMPNFPDEILSPLGENDFWIEIERLNRTSYYPFSSVDLLPSRAEVEHFFDKLSSEQDRQRYKEILESSNSG